jgi:hypothetical protein
MSIISHIDSTEPAFSDIFHYIHNDCKQSLTFLNIGSTEINSDAAMFL